MILCDILSLSSISGEWDKDESNIHNYGRAIDNADAFWLVQSHNQTGTILGHVICKGL